MTEHKKISLLVGLMYLLISLVIAFPLREYSPNEKLALFATLTGVVICLSVFYTELE